MHDVIKAEKWKEIQVSEKTYLKGIRSLTSSADLTTNVSINLMPPVLQTLESS